MHNKELHMYSLPNTIGEMGGKWDVNERDKKEIQKFAQKNWNGEQTWQSILSERILKWILNRMGQQGLDSSGVVQVGLCECYSGFSYFINGMEFNDWVFKKCILLC
jgi:hypothetical protein